MALPIAAGDSGRNLGGYRRISFLAVAFGEGAKEQLDSDCPVGHNLGREQAVTGFVCLCISGEGS